MNSLLKLIKGIFLPQPDERSEVEIGEEAQEINLSDFEQLDFLGRGGFSTVFLCRCRKNNALYSMKIQEDSPEADTECRILSKIAHPCVMSAIYEFTFDRNRYIIMPFAVGGDLEELSHRLGHFSETESRFFAADMVLAIRYIHSLNVVHCDIKLANILLCENGHIKLADFGLSAENMPYGCIRNEIRGTPAFRAPEVWKRDGFGRAVDWWALGVIIYVLLTGSQPFDGVSSILEREPYYGDYISPDAQSILQAFLTKNPATRLGGGPSYDDIRNHRFFGSVNWETQPTSPAPLVPDSDKKYDDQLQQ